MPLLHVVGLTFGDVMLCFVMLYFVLFCYVMFCVLSSLVTIALSYIRVNCFAKTCSFPLGAMGKVVISVCVCGISLSLLHVW